MALTPLVRPAAAVPERELERTARQLRLPEIGELGQRRLFGARVAVLGAGGIGCPVLLALASAGVGRIEIIDDDIVDASNLQRQILYGFDDVGEPKAETAAARLRALAPDLDVVPRRVRLDGANALEALRGADLVIDGSDSFETRYLLADACDELGVPLVWGSVLRFDAQATVFWSRPSAGPAVRLRDVFPAPPAAGTVPSCAEAGVLGAVCGQLGGILAAEAVKLICGIGEPLLGRMLVLDALAGSVREVRLAPRAAGAAPRRVRAEELPAFASAPGAVLLDVREPAEVAAGTIPGARSIPLAQLREQPGLLEADGPVLIFCQRGPRARVAASALAAARPELELALLAGGYAAWADASHAEHAESKERT